MTRNDWTPVVLDLLRLLTEEGGARLLWVDDGGDTTQLPSPSSFLHHSAIRQQAAAAITAVDASTLSIMLDQTAATLSIVLGNEPDEIVQDWVARDASTVYWMLEAITRKFARQWDGKPCPIVPDQYRWSHPYAWLETASAQWDRDRLLREVRRLAGEHDLDALKDLYQGDMEADGYYDPLPILPSDAHQQSTSNQAQGQPA
jgi:hypothetical protein